MPGPMFFFFLIVGLAALVMAVRFAFRPSERGLAVVRPLSAATLCASLVAFFAGVANGLMALARGNLPTQAALAGGFAESLIALILGFAAVTVVWLLVAVGLHRQV